MPSRETVRGLGLLVLINLLYAGTPAFTKWGMEVWSPVHFVWLRHTIALLVLTPWMFGMRWVPLTGRDWLRIAVAAFSAFTCSTLLQCLAMQRSTAGAGALMIAMEPILMIGLALFFLHERLPRRAVMAIGMALAGFALISGGETLMRLEGNALYLLGIACEAIFPILVLPLVRRGSPVQVTWCCLLCASLYLLPWQGTATWAAAPRDWWALVYLGVGCSAVGVSVWLITLRSMQVSTVAVTWFLQPVWGSVMAVVLLGESITWPMAVGGALILSAVWLLPPRAAAMPAHPAPTLHPVPTTLAAYRLPQRRPRRRLQTDWANTPPALYHRPYAPPWRTALVAYYHPARPRGRWQT